MSKEREAEKALIIDAHGLDPAGKYEVDPQTWELITPEIEGSDLGELPEILTGKVDDPT